MSEAARVAVGLPLAALLPASLPWVQRSRLSASVAAAAIAAWTLCPFGTEPFAWLVAAATVATQVLLVRRSTDPSSLRLVLPRPVLAAAVIALAGALASAPRATVDSIGSAFTDDRPLVWTLGLAAATFPVGAVIARLTAPWAVAVADAVGEETSPGIAGAGRFIGWLERTSVFVALMLGHPEALVVIFTAKSVARFPSFSHEAFAEYFLIGTFLSVLAGSGIAILTRLALGLQPV